MLPEAESLPYLNGEAFYEKRTAQEVTETERTWFCQADGNVTIIRANFGKANPNTELTEINVRESIFIRIAMENRQSEQRHQ